MHWLVKAAIQGTLSRTRDPQRWNRLLQKYVTRSLTLQQSFFDEKWHKCKTHMGLMGDGPVPDGESRRPGPVLELGTGWHPVVPIGFALAGYDTVYTVDVESLVHRQPVVEVIGAYLECGDPALDQARLDVARGVLADPSLTGRELMTAVGVTSLVVDARRIPLPSDSIRLFVSNNTFEHIPEQSLKDILREFRRLAKDDAVMSHHIDMGDHYAVFDSSIDVYHFLRFSEKTWRYFNNDLQYQNRLRMSDHVRIHQNSGWSVVARKERRDRESTSGLQIADEFRHYDADDLLVCDGWLWSRPEEPS